MENQQLPIRFKKLHKDAVLPFYGTEFSAGMDCTAVSSPILEEEFVAYDLGLAMEIPAGYVGYLFPRSSISKKSLILANSVGVIDADYRGPVQARFKLASERVNNIYKKGDAICQLIVMPIPKVTPEWADELSDTVRGAGGFGHTGN
jgi:dUTP pyrophosphatase